jgi:hypothetical protein
MVKTADFSLIRSAGQAAGHFVVANTILFTHFIYQFIHYHECF